MKRTLLTLLAVALAGGCSGRYILTAPEQVGPAGGQAVLVSRIQYEEVAGIYPPVKNACIRYRVQDGPVRGAYSDSAGYGAALVPLPAKPGRYSAEIGHTDKDGREVSRFVPVYVWDRSTPVVVVDLDTIGSAADAKAGQAVTALQKINQSANIVYLTQQPLQEHASLHVQMRVSGFPDGPILMWQREYWHTVQEGVMTKVLVEDRLVSQLPELKRTFPNLLGGISGSAMAAESFLKADVRSVFVGQEGLFLPSVNANVRRSSWKEITDRGIEAVAGR